MFSMGRDITLFLHKHTLEGSGSVSIHIGGFGLSINTHWRVRAQYQYTLEGSGSVSIHIGGFGLSIIKLWVLITTYQP